MRARGIDNRRARDTRNCRAQCEQITTFGADWRLDRSKGAMTAVVNRRKVILSI